MRGDDDGNHDHDRGADHRSGDLEEFALFHDQCSATSTHAIREVSRTMSLPATRAIGPQLLDPSSITCARARR